MSRSDWNADDQQSFLVSISDLMASLIFIFIITLMVFALRFDSATTSLRSTTTTRAELLREVQRILKQDGLQVEVDEEQGVLRLGDSSINFVSGRAEPRADHRHRVMLVAKALDDVLPCFIRGQRIRCAPAVLGRLDTVRYAASLDAVLIEGHTDTVPIAPALQGRFRSNMELAGARSSRILELLTEARPRLDSLRNAAGLQVLSISGYGERRLLDTTNRASESNRRIDLRFLMEPLHPESSAPVRAVTRSLGRQQ